MLYCSNPLTLVWIAVCLHSVIKTKYIYYTGNQLWQCLPSGSLPLYYIHFVWNFYIMPKNKISIYLQFAMIKQVTMSRVDNIQISDIITLRHILQFVNYLSCSICIVRDIEYLMVKCTVSKSTGYQQSRDDEPEWSYFLRDRKKNKDS